VLKNKSASKWGTYS